MNPTPNPKIEERNHRTLRQSTRPGPNPTSGACTVRRKGIEDAGTRLSVLLMGHPVPIHGRSPPNMVRYFIKQKLGERYKVPKQDKNYR
jgi:hypothetical protein